MSRTLVRLYAVCAALSLAAACGSDTKKPDGDDEDVSNLAVTTISVTTVEDTPVTGTIEATGQLGAIYATVTQHASHGTLVISGGTGFTYTPLPDYAGPDSAVITVRDDQKTVRVTVNAAVTPVNDPPHLTSTPTLSINEDTFLILSASNIAIADIDDDASDITLTVNAGDGYTVANGNEVHPTTNLNGSIEVSVTVSDGAASTDFDVTVEVAAVNDAPVNLVPATQLTSDDVPFVFGASAVLMVNDVDADVLDVSLSVNDCTLTLSQITGLTFTTGGSAAASALQFRGTKSALNAALYGMIATPPIGFDGLCTIQVVTSDLGATGSGGTLTDSDTINLGVNDIDLPPTITLLGSIVIDEDQPLAFTGARTISIADLDTADSTPTDVVLDVTGGELTLAVVTGITFTNGSVNGSTHLELLGAETAINTALATLTFLPTANANGEKTLTITVTNSAAAPFASGCNISINPVNDAPELGVGTSTIAVLNDTTVAFTGPRLITLADVDNSDTRIVLAITFDSGAQLTFVDQSVVPTVLSPSQLVLDGKPSDISATLATMAWVPPPGFVGTAHVDLTANDDGNIGAGGPLIGSLAVIIAVTSDPVAIADTYATHGNVTLHVASASGVLGNDVDLDGPLLIASFTSPALGTLALDTTDGSFDYTPPTGAPFSQTSFEYTVQDSDGQQATATVTINFLSPWWFVDNTRAAGDGSFDHPFASMASLAGVPFQTGSSIHVRNTGAVYPMPGGLNLPIAVNLIGSGVAVDLGPNGILPVNGPPILEGAITVNGGSHLEGFTVRDVTNAPAGITDFGVASSMKGLLVSGFQIGVNSLGATADIQNADFIGQTNAAIYASVGNGATQLMKNITITDAAQGIVAGTSTNSYHLTIEGVVTRNVSGQGISVIVGGANPAFDRQVAVRRCNLVNAPGGALVVGTSGINIDIADGQGNVRVTDNVLNGWGVAGILIHAGDSPGFELNALLQANTVIADVPGSFGDVAIETRGSTQGLVSYTMLDNTVVGTPLGFRTASSGAYVCSNFTNNQAGAGIVGYDLVGNSFPLYLQNYTGATPAAYLANRGNVGSVADNGTLLLDGGSCTQPPVF